MPARVLPPLAALLAAAFLWLAPVSGAAALPGSSGVLNACVTVKGKPKARGAIRIVASPRNCKKRRGERAIAWNVSAATGAGSAGAAGQTGATGKEGPAGPEGHTGSQGPIGEIDQTLKKTIEAQAAQIKTLEGTVTTLTGKLLSVEGTVGALGTTVGTLGTTVNTLGTNLTNTCAQLAGASAQVNKIAGVVGGITLLNVLNLGGLGLTIPKLPEALPATSC